MSLSMVLGVGITIIIFILFTTLIDKNKHAHIRNFLLVIIFPFLFLIPATLTLEQTVCEVVLANESTYYSYGNNFTYANGTPNYHWDYGVVPTKIDTEAILFHEETVYDYTEHCYEERNGSQGFLKAYVIILLVFMTYIFIIFFTDILDAFRRVVGK